MLIVVSDPFHLYPSYHFIPVGLSSLSASAWPTFLEDEWKEKAT